MGRYTNSLRQSPDDFDDAYKLFDDATPAEERSRDPVPEGHYVADIVPNGCEMFKAKSGTDGYKLAFLIAEGPHKGRRLWMSFWLTKAAAPIARKELAKIGITNSDQLDPRRKTYKPLPLGIRVKVGVVVHESDKGEKWNEVKWFKDVVFNPPSPDPFAPSAPVGDSPAPQANDAATPANDSPAPQANEDDDIFGAVPF